MVLKMLESFGNGKISSTRWWHSKIIGFSLLDALKEDLIPVSIKLRSNIKTPRAKIIIKKTERALLNERIRNINNTITMATHKRDTCINTLSEVFPKEIMEECNRLIFLRREAYYIKVKKKADN